MWRRKKLILIAVLATVLLAGSVGGLAFAQTQNGDGSQSGSLLDRVAEILAGKGINITPEQLKDAFNQAQGDMRDEALDKYLQNLVDEGRITQEQADQYKAWWQARPDMEPYRQQLNEWQQARPTIPPELEEWQKARPDAPLPGPFGRFGGHAFRNDMKWGGAGHFWGR
ncbi:MAG: hypothetical protein HY530_01105 [Chloroflexi bacterium]|nr:hypothetical protein [Chloroflexota bacterium]